MGKELCLKHKAKNVKNVGTKRQVLCGSAEHTYRGVLQKELVRFKGRIVEKGRHAAAVEKFKKGVSLKFVANIRKKGGGVVGAKGAHAYATAHKLKIAN